MKIGDLVELSAQGKKRLWLKPLARLYGVVTEFCDHRWRVQWFGKSKTGRDISGWSTTIDRGSLKHLK